MTVQEIYQLIDAAAPFETQESWDNSGLLVGSPSREVTAVLFALDVSQPVIDEALACGAQLIVTHHPLMFSPRQRLTDEDYEGRLLLRLARHELSLIAAHTCLDRAPGGMNDTLAALCGLENLRGEGFIRVGTLPAALSAEALAAQLSLALGDTVRVLGPGDRTVSCLGLCSGGGGGEWEQAAALGCDAFLSGEIRHHHALAMADAGIVAFECGHAATERPGILVLADALQNAFDTIECKVRIIKSEVDSYSFPPVDPG